MTLRAGTAVADISPTGPTPLFGYPHVERISTGIHDPLLASALYLHNGSEAVVLIALDLLFLEPPAARSLRRAVARRIGTAEDRVFISCTHTHSGPVTARLLAWSDDSAVPPPAAGYLDMLGEKVVEAAARAASQAAPAEIAWTSADARGVGGNRHTAGGVTDPEVGILAVRPASGGPLMATEIVYGMHPPVLHEDTRLVSADFPHYTRRQLCETFGENLVVLYHTGPSGNQSPRFFVHGQTFAEAERLGRHLGRAVGASLERLAASDFVTVHGDCPDFRGKAAKMGLSPSVCERLPDFRQDVPLRGALRTVDLASRAVPAVAEAEAILAQCRAEHRRLQDRQAPAPEVRTAECAVFGAEGTLSLARLHQRGEASRMLRDYRPIEIQVVRIGDGFLAGLPGELFAEYGIEIKRRFPQRVFVVSLVNGELQGYVVTPEAAAQGCYESLTAMFCPEAGKTLVETTLELLETERSP